MSRPPLHLSPNVMERLRDLLYRHTGMSFGENKRYYIERRIAARMTHLGIGDPHAYLAIAASGGEIEHLVNAFTINETYFYREEQQLAALARDMLPMVVENRRPGDLVRIWSLPCSSGEEPYSIAIWLLENWPLVDVYNIEIVGSDIDTQMLAAARAGRFHARSLARLPPLVVNAYFEPEHCHTRQIIADLRDSVRFTATNLIDATSVAMQGRFDVILCRNLFIYFDDATRVAASTHLHKALNPGGFLCLGRSESLARVSDDFTQMRLGEAIVYRKDGG